MPRTAFVALCVLASLISAFEMTTVSPTWAQDYSQNRSTWSGLRVLAIFNETFFPVPASNMTELQEDIVPVVVRFFGRVLKAPRLTAKLKVPMQDCAQAVVPVDHRNVGVDADVVIYVVMIPNSIHDPNDQTSYGTVCLLSKVVPHRVLAGSIWLQMDVFSTLTRNQKIDLVARHFAQALGFDSLLFRLYNKPDGSLYGANEIFANTAMAGNERFVLKLPTVVEKTRLAFNCPSLVGVRMEGSNTNDDDGNDYRRDYSCYKYTFYNFLTMWSAKIMLNDFMSELILSPQAEYSSVTFAVFQDSGWYDVDWSYTAPPRFSYMRGCEFFDKSCLSDKTPNFPEFCSPDEQTCSTDLTMKGRCTVIFHPCGIPDPYRCFDTYWGGPRAIDSCPVVASGISCLEGDSTTAEEEYCPECRCFTGLYRSLNSTQPASNIHCHRVFCENGKAFVSIGSTIVECPPAGGLMNITGYSGQIKCPTVERICKPTPCKNLCSGRGKCVLGKCECESGFFGEDCGLTCLASCLSCSTTSNTTCTSCHRGAYLSNEICMCETGFNMTLAGECVSTKACDKSCLSCYGSGPNDCKACRNPATLSSSGNCECPQGQTMNPSGDCVACGSGCKTCSYLNTSTCITRRSLVDTCSVGEYFSQASSKCEKCYSPCLTCAGSPTSCISCITNYKLQGSDCICPAGFFVLTGQCLPCHANCATCSSNGEFDCTSCRSNGLLKSVPGPCICRNNNNTACTRCDSECFECSPADAFTCYSCKNNTDFDWPNNRCTCIEGFYPSPDAGNCQLCHATCLACKGPLYTQCTKCPQNFDFLGSGTCLCNATRYYDQTLQKCNSCSPFCQSCSSPVCGTCVWGFTLNSTSSACEPADGLYYEESSKTTFTCPSHCRHCSFDKARSLLCNECKETFLMDNNNNCYCDVGKEVPWSTERCLNCKDPNCAHCDMWLNCYQCLPTYSMINWQCLCNPGFYEVNHTCQACATGCATCTGPSDLECTTCLDHHYLNSTYCLLCNDFCANCNGPDDNQCISCPSYSELIGSKCWCNFKVTQTTCFYDPERDKCHANCSQCNGPTERDCISCYPTGRLEHGTCRCLDSSIVDRCRPCAADCGNCDGSGGCKDCYQWYAYIEIPGVCRCPGHTYPNPDTFNCAWCHSWCYDCTGPGPNQCTSCRYGTMLQSDNTCQCVGLCAISSEGPVFSPNYFCKDRFCLTCKNGAIGNQYWWFNSWVGNCYCPESTALGTGLYSDKLAGICHACSSLCANCARDPDACWNCKANAYMTSLSRFGGPGACACNTGFYLSYQYEECWKCPPGCTACDSETVCTACEYGYEIVRSDKQATCDCYSQLCQCPRLMFEVPPFRKCELSCPTGFNGTERRCLPTNNTAFEFVFRNNKTQFEDGSGRAEAVLGDVSVAGSAPKAVLKNGVLFPAGKMTSITISGKNNDLILGPIHFIEMWQKAAAWLSIKKGTDRLTFSHDSNVIYFLFSHNDSSTISHSFDFTTQPSPGWNGIRYEFVPYKVRQGTTFRVLVNDIAILEQNFIGEFFRDGAFDSQNTDIKIWWNSNTEAFLGELRIASGLWTEAPVIADCGCPNCTRLGSCLSSCNSMEFQKEDMSCAACDPKCTNGCARGNDCSLNVDALCEKFSDFEKCESCKELAKSVNGTCRCVNLSTFRDNNNTCTCNTHYEKVNSTCEFRPDPQCQVYTKEPVCDKCVPLAESIDDFCRCTSLSTYSATSHACECNPHTIFNGTRCLRDLLCDTVEPSTLECIECTPHSFYSNGICHCSGNATMSSDGKDCACNVDFKPYLRKCIPEYDPLCESVNSDGGCGACKWQASLSQGICSCVDHSSFDLVSKTCICEKKYATIGNECILSDDPMCLAFDNSKKCKLCVSLAAPVNGNCSCVEHASLQTNGICTCGVHYAAKDGVCVFQPDPLCDSYSPEHQCLQCKALSEQKDDFCSCTANATLSVTGQSCECAYHYKLVDSTCQYDNDPLCVSFTADLTCLKCAELANLNGEKCSCIENASPTTDGHKCRCDSGLKLAIPYCIPIDDPLCETSSDSGCQQCKDLSSLVKGACLCVDNAMYNNETRTCECKDYYAAWKDTCILNSDPLCTALTDDKGCSACKTLAVLKFGICSCTENASLLSNHTCACELHYAPSDSQCVFQPDPLCDLYNPKNQCLQCKAFSEKQNDFCQCVDNAEITTQSKCTCKVHYKGQDNRCGFDVDPLCLNYTTSCQTCKAHSVLKDAYCTCLPTYALKQGQDTCELCLNFLSNDEFSVVLTKDFKQLVISFASPVQTNATCKTLFQKEVFAKFGTGVDCLWNGNGTELDVVLGDDASIVEENIILNETLILKKSGICVFTHTTLEQTIKYQGSKPTLRPALNAPVSVSLSCPDSPTITIDAKGSIGGMGVPLLYKWTLVHSSLGALFPEYGVYSSMDSINIPVNSLVSGSLSVTTTLKDRLGQTATSLPASIEFINDHSLSVAFDLGSYLNLTSDSKGVIRAIVMSTCGQKGKRTYTWSYKGASPDLQEGDDDPSLLLTVSRTPYQFVIVKGALTPGYVYTYNVEVNQGTLTGSAVLQFLMNPSNLIVRLNRGGGNHSSEVPLLIHANMTRDPDLLKGVMTFSWICQETGGECKDSNLERLIAPASPGYIFISPERLRVNATYNFTVTVKKDIRSVSASILITVVPPVGCNVLLPAVFKNALRHQYFYLMPTVDSRLQIAFSWQQVVSKTGVVVKPDSPPGASYLAFEAGKLTAGQLYNFDMKVASQLGTMHMQVSFYIISEPEQGLLFVSPSSGIAVITTFSISTSGWVDKDNDYPLSYQFCYLLPTKTEVCVSSVQPMPQKSTKLSPGSFPVIVKAINSLGGVGVASSSVIVEKIPFYRRLADTNISAYFLEDIEDPENTLGMIGVYSSSVSIDQSFYSLILTSLQNYMNGLFEVSAETLNSYLSVVTTLLAQNITRTAGNSQALVQLTNTTLGRITDEISDDMLSKIAAFAAERKEAEALMEATVKKYYESRLPSDTSFTFATNSLNFYSVRQLRDSIPQGNISIGNISVSIPSEWLSRNGTASTDVFDLRLKAGFNSSWEVSVSLWKSGSYSNYNIQLLASPTALSFYNATQPYNISIPASIGNETVECVGLNSTGEWSPYLCSIVAVSPSTVVISTRSATTFSLKTFAKTVVPLPIPNGNGGNISNPLPETDINPVAAVISFVLLVVGCGVVARLSRKVEIEFEEVQQRYSSEGFDEKQDISPREGEQVLEINSEQLPTKPSDIIQSTPLQSAHDNNIIISADAKKTAWHASLIMFILLGETLVLGVCYSVWEDENRSIDSAKGVWKSYSGEDLRYLAIALAIGTVMSVLLQASTQLGRLWRAGVLVCVTGSVIAFGAILYLNVTLEYGRGGKWGEGTLWAILLQLGVVEVLKAGVAWIIRKVREATY